MINDVEASVMTEAVTPTVKGLQASVLAIQEPSTDNGLLPFVASARFHQGFTFESKTTSSTLSVSFGVAGVQANDAPAILFCSGMYGGRWNAPWIDFLATKSGVRVIMVDRPGLGGSTHVPTNQRLNVWLETVPALLKHLDLKHVMLASHSCGAIYALNTLYHYPEIVGPGTPAIFLLSPWVHPSKSGAKMLSLASAMPSGIVSGWNKMNGVFARAFTSSVDALSKSQKGGAQGIKLPASESQIVDNCGISKIECQKLRELCIKMFFAEDTTGAGDDAVVALKSNADITWGACNDYATFVPDLAKLIAVRSGSDKLIVKAWFGAKDTWLGKGGRKYLDDCWATSARGGQIFYESDEVPNLDHDGVALPENGVLEKLFLEAKRLSTRS